MQPQITVPSSWRFIDWRFSIMNRTKHITFSGACIALGILLPMMFHSIPNAGSIFLPMHIPVLLCGLICGPLWGAVCGALTPLLSSLITNMPPMAILPGMLCELTVYGLVSGLLIRHLPIKKSSLQIYASLIPAMVCGRIVSGLINGLIIQLGTYSLQIWLTNSFITALPGIIIQLILLPVLVLALQKAGFTLQTNHHTSTSSDK